MGLPRTASTLLYNLLALDPDARPATVHEVATRLLAIREEWAALPPAMRTAGVSVAAGSGPPAAPSIGSGSASGGPKIISAKLDAESRKRRPGRATCGGAPTAAGRSGPPAGWRNFAIGATALTVMVAGIAFALRKGPGDPTPKPIPKPIRPASEAKNPVAPPVAGATGGNAPGGNAPNGAAPSGVAPSGGGATLQPAAIDPSRITDFGAVCKGVIVDSGGAGALHIDANGRADLPEGVRVDVTAYFYDAQNAPVAAVDAGSPYASSNGQLSIHKQAVVDADAKTFRASLDVPLAQFPQDPRTVARFRCVVSLNGQRVDRWDLQPIAPDLYRPTGAPTGPESGTPPTHPHGVTLPDNTNGE